MCLCSFAFAVLVWLYVDLWSPFWAVDPSFWILNECWCELVRWNARFGCCCGSRCKFYSNFVFTWNYGSLWSLFVVKFIWFFGEKSCSFCLGCLREEILEMGGLSWTEDLDLCTMKVVYLAMKVLCFEATPYVWDTLYISYTVISYTSALSKYSKQPGNELESHILSADEVGFLGIHHICKRILEIKKKVENFWNFSEINLTFAWTVWPRKIFHDIVRGRKQKQHYTEVSIHIFYP